MGLSDSDFDFGDRNHISKTCAKRDQWIHRLSHAQIHAESGSVGLRKQADGLDLAGVGCDSAGCYDSAVLASWRKWRGSTGYSADDRTDFVDHSGRNGIESKV